MATLEDVFSIGAIRAALLARLKQDAVATLACASRACRAAVAAERDARTVPFPAGAFLAVLPVCWRMESDVDLTHIDFNQWWWHYDSRADVLAVRNRGQVSVWHGHGMPGHGMRVNVRLQFLLDVDFELKLGDHGRLLLHAYADDHDDRDAECVAVYSTVTGRLLRVFDDATIGVCTHCNVVIAATREARRRHEPHLSFRRLSLGAEGSEGAEGTDGTEVHDEGVERLVVQEVPGTPNWDAWTNRVVFSSDGASWVVLSLSYTNQLTLSLRQWASDPSGDEVVVTFAPVADVAYYPAADIRVGPGGVIVVRVEYVLNGAAKGESVLTTWTVRNGHLLTVTSRPQRSDRQHRSVSEFRMAAGLTSYVTGAQELCVCDGDATKVFPLKRYLESRTDLENREVVLADPVSRTFYVVSV